MGLPVGLDNPDFLNWIYAPNAEMGEAGPTKRAPAIARAPVITKHRFGLPIAQSVPTDSPDGSPRPREP